MSTIFDTALNYLSFRSRSEKEVRDYLTRKKFRKDLIDETIEKLKYYKYIDDLQYTRLLIESNEQGQRYGKERLKRSMQAKGITGDLELELLEELVDYPMECYFCEYHFKKALKRTEGDPYKKRVPKIISYLERRGFNREHYQGMLSEIPKDNQVDQDNFQKHLLHYKKLYERKGYEGFELKNRIIKGMLSRGYNYEMVKDALAEMEDN